METSLEIDVESLDAAHRRAFEDVIGAPLELNQRLLIHVTEPTSRRTSQSLADWAGVYDGMTEDQIGVIDQNIRKRANLTRDLG